MKFIEAVFFSLSAACYFGGAEQESIGLIDGIVIYEGGRPVRAATAYAEPMDKPMLGIFPPAQTDETGRFVIDHLPLGKFAEAAGKRMKTIQT
jgi:hypothetical protein